MPTPIGPIDDRPIPVDFPELNENPANYRDKLIRVTGTYTRLPLPECVHVSGPQLEWALVAGNLRLDARGFEPVLRLLPGDTTMTVDGFWRFYEGPIGCGKEPPDGAAWYLETLQVVQPNPLPGVFQAAVPDPVEQPPDPLAPTPDTEPTVGPELQITLLPGTQTATTTPSPSPTGSRIPTGTPTRTPTVPGTATVTVTPTRTGTPTVTVTGTPPTPVPTPTPSRTPDPGATLPPPPTLPGSTPPGYPGPGETPGPPPYP